MARNKLSFARDIRENKEQKEKDVCFDFELSEAAEKPVASATCSVYNRNISSSPDQGPIYRYLAGLLVELAYPNNSMVFTD